MAEYQDYASSELKVCGQIPENISKSHLFSAAVLMNIKRGYDADVVDFAVQSSRETRGRVSVLKLGVGVGTLAFHTNGISSHAA